MQSVTRTDLQVSLAMLMAIFVALTVWSAFINADGKYILYTLPVTVFISHLLFKRTHIKIDGGAITALVLFVGITAVSLLNAGHMVNYTVRDIFIIFGCLSFFLFRHKSSPIVPLTSLVILTIAMVFEYSGTTDYTSVAGKFEIDLEGSQGLAESSLAFPLGLLVIYFFYAKRWLALLIATVVFFAAFKRLAMAAVLLVIALQMFMALLGYRTIPRTIALLVAVICSIISMYSLELFKLAADLAADPDISANGLSLGRVEMAEQLWMRINNAGFVDRLLGFGPGSSDTVLMPVAGGPNPHNDWLKILFDYGAFGFVIMHLVLYLVHDKGGVAPLLYIYTAIIMMTDNVLLYMFHFIFIYVLVNMASPVVSATRQPNPSPTASQNLKPALIS